MNLSKNIYAWTFLFSIALFVSAEILFTQAFGLFEPKIDGILFKITEHDGLFNTSLLFSFTLALIPIFLLSTWRLARVISLNKQIISVLLVLSFIVLAIFVRHQEVKIYFKTVVRPVLLTNGKKSILYPIDPVNFVYYIFLGLCVGCILSGILLRNKRLKV